MIINITVKPNSTKGPLLEPRIDGSMVVYIREIATDGKANEALVKLLANHYKISKKHVEILKGHRSRHKLVQITSSSSA